MKTEKQSVGLDFLHIIWLVFTDLRFEWILSLCMVLALGAVFAPLFILLGLQGGIIGNMLDELQKDPVSRLVMPKWETSLDDSWLKSLREQTAALIESPTAFLLLDVEGMDDPVNVLPTSNADPLLKENKITLTNRTQSLVLSTPLAKALRKQQGDRITLTLIRSTGYEERIPVHMQVSGYYLPRPVRMPKYGWMLICSNNSINGAGAGPSRISIFPEAGRRLPRNMTASSLCWKKSLRMRNTEA